MKLDGTSLTEQLRQELVAALDRAAEHGAPRCLTCSAFIAGVTVGDFQFDRDDARSDRHQVTFTATAELTLMPCGHSLQRLPAGSQAEPVTRREPGRVDEPGTARVNCGRLGAERGSDEPGTPA